MITTKFDEIIGLTTNAILEGMVPDLIDDWIKPRLTRDFLLDIEEGQTTAFAMGHSTAIKLAEPSEYRSFVAQAKHMYAEKEFRHSGQRAGLETMVVPTRPPGGSFSFIKVDGLYLLRTNIQPHCGVPRASKFRKTKAEFNKWLNSEQLDFFKPLIEAPDNRLCAMLIVTRYPYGFDQSTPAFVGRGIPSDDLSCWMGGPWSIAQLSARYTKSYTPPDTPIAPTDPPISVIKDNAVPRLRR